MAIPKNPITRKEHFLAKAAGESVNTPDPITREEMYLDAIASGGSALPAVTSADNGKVLSVVDGAWAADNNRFVVTCTPTAQDYSGTMDKTVGEIDIAYENGKSVEFVIPGVAAVPLSAVKWVQTGSGYASVFVAQLTMTDSNMMVVLYTDSLSIAKIYHTKIYQLTPMGG